MNVEEIRAYCLNKKGVSESLPFGDTVLVFKVMNRMFALLNLEEDSSINLKCNPDKAIALREEFPYILPGYHMNKNHWNTIILTGTYNTNLLKCWIDDSYNLVVEKLPKKQKEILNEMG